MLSSVQGHHLARQQPLVVVEAVAGYSYLTLVGLSSPVTTGELSAAWNLVYSHILGTVALTPVGQQLTNTHWGCFGLQLFLV